ncbi:MAG: DUF5615 family PIN-like protein, partial [Spirochaetia bacterium]|nr:DUF5615 family PIN-like protein [Spirochaetia bacterium]
DLKNILKDNSFDAHLVFDENIQGIDDKSLINISKKENRIFLTMDLDFSDIREGCNPIISRCGNHFSYNEIHSQVRNKISNHENREYTYVFEHFGKYDEENKAVLTALTNEMERRLNIEMQALIDKYENCKTVNSYKGTGYVSRKERERRESFRTPDYKAKIQSIVKVVKSEIGG